MNVSIRQTFRITSRNLFVIVTDAQYNDLIGIKQVFDQERQISFPIFSVEWINLSGLSMPGITLKYEKDKDLILLGTLTKHTIIIE